MSAIPTTARRASTTMKLLSVETKLLVREPGSMFSFAIPLFILVVFGGGLARGDVALVPTALAVSLGLVALYLMPTALATYREQGVLRRMSATPVHPASLLAAQLAIQFVLAMVSAATLVVVAMVALGAGAPREAGLFIAALALGAVSMFAVGMVIAALAPSGRAANGIGVLLYFPLAYVSGLLQPVSLMPATMVRIGEFTPLGAFRRAAQEAWMGAVADPLPMVVMAVYAVGLTLAAARLFRWE